MIAEYYRYISYLDAQIGRILDALDASPHARNTIVVFAADSGVARGSHGLIGKQNLYEHSVRVPLVIRGPGMPAGKRSDALCYLFDVLPTLGKWCNVPAPKTSEGVEFTASLRDPMRPARPQLLFAYRNVQRAVRDDRWKLIRYPQIDKTQLFDLQTDPHETTNLADRPEQAARVAALLALLAKEQQQHGDTAPLRVPRPKPAQWAPPQQGKPAGSSLRRRAAGRGLWAVLHRPVRRGTYPRPILFSLSFVALHLPHTPALPLNLAFRAGFQATSTLA
jgi:arylsulfatase A-like enzyme